MGKTKSLIIILLLLSAEIVLAQKDRYVVFFQDKDNSSFSISSPEQYLSQRAIQRREKQNISISEEDLPVNESYVNSLSDLGIETYFRTKWFNGVLVEATSAQVNQAMQLSFVREVEYVAPGEKLQPFVDDLPELGPFFSPADTELSTDFQNNMLAVPQMHEEGFKGEGMLIAVIDGGFTGVENSVAFQHLKDKKRLFHTMDFVSNRTNVFRESSHGTQVLSCIAAKYGEQLIGTAYEADIVLLMSEDVDEEYRIEEFNWVFAAELADSLGVDVINSSIGYIDFDDDAMNYEFDELDGITSVISRASDIAFSKGMILVTSAGNTSSNITTPADAFNVISVGSVDKAGEKSLFSAFFDTSDGRTKPEVVAYGSSTVTMRGGGDIGTSSGTSFASPLIAGFTAGVWQAFPDKTNIEIVDLIKESGSRSSQVDELLGYGIPNFITVNGGVINSTEVEKISDELKIYPNPSINKMFTIESFPPFENGTKILIRDVTGKILYSLKTVNSEKVVIQMEDFSPATYLVSIQSEKEFVTKRVVIR